MKPYWEELKKLSTILSISDGIILLIIGLSIGWQPPHTGIVLLILFVGVALTMIGSIRADFE